MRIMVTGATGFLGKHIVRYLAQKGHDVIAASRLGSEGWDDKTLCVRSFAYSLDSALCDIDELKEVNCIIHCAWRMQGTADQLQKSNLKALEELRRFAVMHGTHLIFISSLAAHSEARSNYGRIKFQAEKILEGVPYLTIVRPGTIVGDGGLFARSQAILKKVPVVPLFYGGEQRIQMVGIEDLCSALAVISDQRMLGLFSLGSYPGLKMKDFYEKMARRMGLHRIFVGFPGDLTWFLLKIIEMTGIVPPISSDNLLGLKYHREVNCLADWDRLQLVPHESFNE